MHLSINKNLRRFAAFAAILLALMTMPSAFAATYGNLDVQVPAGEYVSLVYGSQSGNTFYFDEDTSLPGYYPSVFSLEIVPDAGVSVASVTTNNGSYVTHYTGNYYVVSLVDGEDTNITIVSDGATDYTYVLYCVEPDGGSGGSNSGIYAYLPAPGQFVNENVTTGGWGTIYTSGNPPTTVKSMVNNVVTTGVSLGYFGGYVVLDYGAPQKESGVVISGIYNDATNKYGVDFVVYGNPLSTFAEPGCVQVSLNGVDWYDLAGSLYYDTAVTTKNFSLTYANPAASDDDPLNSFGYTGTSGNNVTYSGSESGSVLYNPFHRHSYFPLYCNYFTAQIPALGVLPKTNLLNFAGYTSYVAPSTAATITLSGVRIKIGSGTNEYDPDDYIFGYADVRMVGSKDGTPYNPYDPARTTGGDPFDLSWAVNSSGEPINLEDGIRFVRVYTGTTQHNGAFGESSTEVCGSYRVTQTGSGESQTDLYIEDESSSEIVTSNMETETVYQSSSSANYYIDASDTYLYVNGVQVSSPYTLSVSLASPETKYYQIITQNGDTGYRSPYITVLKIVRN